ncbi:pyridine nucleotide-disulfide oxidoreductase [Rhodobacteraceae bacterium 2CG4]|uniref:Pyridine nucleotide-disulfide oxidoreductase n=1 Tax=Halovulum marinum TaxID=2662447 RepID=A0A6L5Z5T7_9RHOB|nr:FAD-dependent oxidoreductase [Halovulum marinum]MSU91948.1 pyridine nucleotide-disulfide oxidoreductase [Halovulum marinum]
MSGIVVVGAGQAGATLVEKLRTGGHDGPLTLIGAEPHPPYQRPPLSKKYLLGEMAPERLFLRPLSFYAENDIALRTGTRVTGIDRQARQIHLAGGAPVPYDKLALCLGSRPRRLPPGLGGSLQGVYTVRDLADVDRMAPEFAAGRRALIVGGGYIGLEAAAVAAARGLKVTLIEMSDRILCRVAAAETARFFRDLHAGHGVDLREGVGLELLTGTDGRVTQARLTDGTALDVDFVVAGIGIEPETWLAEAAGLETENGIRVDAHGRTSDPDIYAAGDCTSFPYRDTRVRLESVPNAIDQAEVVARAMLGQPSGYVARPWFWSDQYDVKLQIAGLNTGYDRVVTRPGSRPGALSVWYFRGDRLLAVDAMNEPRAYMLGKRWIEAGVSPDPARIADPAADLKVMSAG